MIVLHESKSGIRPGLHWVSRRPPGDSSDRLSLAQQLAFKRFWKAQEETKLAVGGPENRSHQISEQHPV